MFGIDCLVNSYLKNPSGKEPYSFTYGIRHNCLYSAILNPCTLSRLPPPCYLRVETLIPLHQCLMIDTGCSTDLICGHAMLDP